jgi:hypothetical protein
LFTNPRLLCAFAAAPARTAAAIIRIFFIVSCYLERDELLRELPELLRELPDELLPMLLRDEPLDEDELRE